MEQIIKDNYESTKFRGLITENTTSKEFILKLEEEVQEFIEAEIFKLPNRNEELADIILVCLNFAAHKGIDIERELICKIGKNKLRAHSAQKQP